MLRRKLFLQSSSKKGNSFSCSSSFATDVAAGGGLALLCSVRQFSSSSLNPPPGVSSQELLSNIKSSHQATANLRMAEQQRQQEAEIMRQQTQKYRDGLLQETKDRHARAGGVPGTLSSDLSRFQNNNINGKSSSSSAGDTATSTTTSDNLHYSVPSNPLAIGRDQLVLSLWQSILSGRRALFLTGPDGVGCSTVASQFAEQARRSGRFSCIHWFSCSRTTSNVSSPVVGQSIQPPSLDQLREFVTKMRKRKEDEVLLVFDQCENPTEILKALHSTFVAMKEQQKELGIKSSSGNNSSANTTAQESKSENNNMVSEDPTSPAKYLFTGPPQLSSSQSRSHYSRLHLLFVVPQKMDKQTGKIVNPLDELLNVTVSVSHRNSGEISSNSNNTNTTLTLASEFCPGVVNVEPVDEVPAMLLTERLIQNHIVEYQRHQQSVEVLNATGKLLSQQQQEQAMARNKSNNFDQQEQAEDDSSDINNNNLAPPPALSDPHLQLICQSVANVPLLLHLASNFVASQLMVSERVRALAKRGECVVADEEKALFSEIIEKKLLTEIIAEKACKNKTAENPDGVLSLSAAAAELCLATIDTILSLPSQSTPLTDTGIIITSAFIKRIVISLASLNLSSMSSSVVEAVIVESAKQQEDDQRHECNNNNKLSKFLQASSENREEVVNDTVLILRRCGFLSDSMVASSSSDSVASKTQSSSSIGGEDVVVNHKRFKSSSSSSIIEEETFTVHPCLADGLLAKVHHQQQQGQHQQTLQSQTLPSLPTSLVPLHRALLNLFVKATARNDLTARMQIANHVDALSRSSSSSLALQSSFSSDVVDTAAAALLRHQVELFERVANFLASDLHQNAESRRLAKNLWLHLYKILSSSSSVQPLNDDIDEQRASRVAVDLGRLLNAEFEFKSSRNLFTSADESDRELSFMSTFLEQASERCCQGASGTQQRDDVVASKNVLWAQLISLRARLIDPEDAKSLKILGDAAQILENELLNPSTATSSSSSSSSVRSAVGSSQQEKYREMMRMREEHFVLLVAWAQAARIQQKEVPKKHIDKMNALYESLQNMKKASSSSNGTL